MSRVRIGGSKHVGSRTKKTRRCYLQNGGESFSSGHGVPFHVAATNVHVQFCERPGVRLPRATHRNIYVRSHRAGDRVMSSVCRFVTTQLRLKVNVSKSAVARPEERKFLGFRITNDGRQRQIAPQALARFKMRIRELTRRTLGLSLPQLVEQLAPWTRGFAGDSGCTSGGSGSLGGTASRNCGDEASPSSPQQSPQGHRPGSGGCPATRPSSKPCAIAISTLLAFRNSLRLPMHNPIEPPWYVTRMPGGVTGKAREGLPMSIKYPDLAVCRNMRKSGRKLPV